MKAIDSIESNIIIAAAGARRDVRMAITWVSIESGQIGVFVGCNPDASYNLNTFWVQRSDDSKVTHFWVYDGIGEPGLTWDSDRLSAGDLGGLLEMTEEQIELLAEMHEYLIGTAVNDDDADEGMEMFWLTEDPVDERLLVSRVCWDRLICLGDDEGGEVYYFNAFDSPDEEALIREVLEFWSVSLGTWKSAGEAMILTQ